ncbi:MAG: relaxase [Chitinophagaceae bacterium]|nr:MAG: relaxase [Chitinophagaceae bacterium]
MVAKITSPARIIAALNYNENKVQEGKAECLHASGYLRDASDMNFYQKLEGFERLNNLNSRAATKTLHISLNFDPSEKLSHDKLITIATDYMEKIGFGMQPWLMYKHKDAGHPHIHIVTTTIQDDGKRIDTYNIGRNQSEKARKEIEQSYGLVRAENQKRLFNKQIMPVHAEKVGYGKTETKKGITNVVNAVLNTYRFSSLPEFNAILRAYNVVADRGQQDGRIYKHKGLMYRVLDKDSNKIGVPIKASSINSKPTLEKLESLFEKNKALKEPFKNALKNLIDQVLASQPRDMNTFIRALEQMNIAAVLRQNIEGKIYGITFVDNNNKTVFNGSDIGKAYSAAHLTTELASFAKQNKAHQNIPETKGMDALQLSPENLVDLLLSQQVQPDYVPVQLLKKKRRKKRKSLGL